MDTTLNIRADILERIDHAAARIGLSRTRVAVLLLKQVMTNIGNPEPIGKLVRYQRPCNTFDWRVIHVWFHEDEFEYFQDLRKLQKMSLSLILFIGVQKYLGKLLKYKKTDNYRFINYVLAKVIFENTLCWRMVWGFPPNLDSFGRT